MKLARLSIFILLFIAPFFVNAQADFSKNSSFKDRIYTGGNVDFSISNIVTSIGVSPLVGYMVTERFSVGVGGTYQVNRFRQIDLTLNNYGVRTFARYNVTQEFFAYTEYEYLIFEFNDGASEVQSEGFSSFFVGGGYAVPVSKNISFLAIALYNLTYDDFRSPYPSPIVLRGGIVASF